MFRPVCRVCQFSLPLNTTYLSNEQAYFGVLPRDQASFEAACQHQDVRLGAGIYGCPAMREALQPRLPSRPDLPAAASSRPVPVPPSSDALALPPSSSAMQEIMPQFQSLGDNCEFGLVQRWAETEPLDLLRFAGFSIPIEHRLAQTIKALMEGFAGLGDPESVACELHGENHPREFMIRETCWQLLYHTGNHEGEVEPEELRLQQVKALRFRRRKLLEDLEAARQVWVWKSNAPTSEADVRDLLACLRRYGPNLLLWVVTADRDHPAGLVEYAGHGLLKGYISRFAPYEAAGDIEFESWHALCRSAAAAADLLRRCGEWGHLDAAAPAGLRPNAAPPLGEIALEDAAASVHWEERRSETLAAGPVFIGDSFRNSRDKDWFQKNPGSQDVRSAMLYDVVMDSACSVLLQGGRKIRETRYLVDSEDEYKKVHAIPAGLRFIKTDKIAVIGFNRAARNFYHWMTQALPAISLSVSRIGAERCALVVPPLAPWQKETIAMLGLADIPHIAVDVSHHYHFPRAYFCEYLSGRTAFFLSPRTLELFDKLAEQVEVPAGGPELLYVARSDTPNRPVTNEQEVQALMATCGFVTVVPGSMTLREQVRLFRGARIIVGPHGAGLTNIAFCKPETTVLELVQASYANPCMNRIAQARGLDYHAECFESASGADVHKQPWAIDTTRLMAKLRAL